MQVIDGGQEPADGEVLDGGDRRRGVTTRHADIVVAHPRPRALLERRPGHGRPVGVGHREARVGQQQVDPLDRRGDLILMQVGLQRAMQRPATSAARSPLNSSISSSDSGVPRQPQRIVRSFGSAEKQTPWSTPSKRPSGHGAAGGRPFDRCC